MKVLGLCSGRKNGNTEIMMKEAFMAIEEKCGETFALLEKLPELTLPAIEQLSGRKDVAKMVKDGRTVYVIGNFDDKDLVDQVVVAVKATNVADVYPVKLGTRVEKR